MKIINYPPTPTPIIFNLVILKVASQKSVVTPALNDISQGMGQPKLHLKYNRG